MHAKHAFSLVELSIVLVILGLLVGGILAGRSLIRASELRSVSTEHSRYLAATNAFIDKYFYPPGDLPNATTIWGKNNAACPADPGTNATPGACNGDGDKLVYGNSLNFESWGFWQQLQLAGMIEGQLSGRRCGNGSGCRTSATLAINENIPASKLPKAGWNVSSDWNCGSDTINLLASSCADIRGAGNFFAIGAEAPFDTKYLLGTPMNAEEAWNIDRKMDDGMPSRGKVMANIDNCVGGVAADRDNPYLLSLSATQYCRLFFIRQF